MISDFKLLGINETDDISVIKNAYHSRIKQLHPDTTDNLELVNNHFLFIAVCKAYQRLISKSSIVSKKEGNSVINHDSKDIKSVVEHKDPAYVYYKNGINIFVRIRLGHPREATLISRGRRIAKTIGRRPRRDRRKTAQSFHGRHTK